MFIFYNFSSVSILPGGFQIEDGVHGDGEQRMAAGSGDIANNPDVITYRTDETLCFSWFLRTTTKLP